MAVESTWWREDAGESRAPAVKLSIHDWKHCSREGEPCLDARASLIVTSLPWCHMIAE